MDNSIPPAQPGDLPRAVDTRRAGSRILRKPTLSGLWAHADFVNLWAAQTVSQFGAQITLLALPLAAALSLHASAGQMGLLGAAGTAPALLVGLLVGAWVDRLRRRPLMVAADLGRAALLTIIPVAWALDLLRMDVLYAVAFTTGLLTVCFDIAYQSYLPGVVTREQLVESNSKLQASASIAQVAGPGIAGVLVGLVAAPFAIIANAVTYLCSALSISRIRAHEPAPERKADSRVLREIGEGVGVVWRSPTLRAMTLTASCSTLFGYVFLAVYILYMTDDLGFGAGQIGLVFGLGGVGALLGALLAGPAARRLGLGPTIILGRLLFGVGGLLIPLAVAVRGLEVPLVVAAEFIQWLVLLVGTVNEVSLRQASAPLRLQGRVNATVRFAVAGIIPIGSLLGGVLGDAIGLRATLVVAVVGMLLAAVINLFSPLRHVRTQPEQVEDEEPVLALSTA